jgi:hypothetical protein
MPNKHLLEQIAEFLSTLFHARRQISAGSWHLHKRGQGNWQKHFPAIPDVIPYFPEQGIAYSNNERW